MLKIHNTDGTKRNDIYMKIVSNGILLNHNRALTLKARSSNMYTILYPGQNDPFYYYKILQKFI